jgi:hypothetical protein
MNQPKDWSMGQFDNTTTTSFLWNKVTYCPYWLSHGSLSRYCLAMSSLGCPLSRSEMRPHRCSRLFRYTSADFRKQSARMRAVYIYIGGAFLRAYGGLIRGAVRMLLEGEFKQDARLLASSCLLPRIYAEIVRLHTSTYGRGESACWPQQQLECIFCGHDVCARGLIFCCQRKSEQMRQNFSSKTLEYYLSIENFQPLLANRCT